MRSERNVVVLLGERLRRLVSQKLQVLAQYSTCQGGVDDVVDEPSPSGNLRSAEATQSTKIAPVRWCERT